MYKLNMHSGAFSHAPSSTWYKKSDYIIWNYGSRDNNVTFFLDGDLFQGFNERNDGRMKFLWGLESPQYNDNFIGKVKNNLDLVLETFELIFTYSDELISLDPKFVFCPANGFWVEEPMIYNKTKKVSMICSDKEKTNLQKFRVNYARENMNNIDVYGHLCRGIQKKEEGLKDYMFSICVENEIHDTYFTEKILDAFATGTIPVYKGTKKIINHFNENGIIFLDDCNLEDLNEDLYYSKIEYVKENFEKVLGLNVLENWMFEKYLNNLL